MDLVHQLTCGQISGFFGGRTDPWLLQFHDVLRPSCRVALTTALEVKDGKTVRKLLKGEAGSMDWVASLQNADGICHWDVLDGFYGLLKRMRWNHPFRIHCVRCWRCWRLAVWILPQASPDSGVELSLIRRTWRVSCWTLLGTLIFLCLCVCFKSVELILKKTYIYIYEFFFIFIFLKVFSHVWEMKLAEPSICHPSRGTRRVGWLRRATQGVASSPTAENPTCAARRSLLVWMSVFFKEM